MVMSEPTKRNRQQDDGGHSEKTCTRRQFFASLAYTAVDRVQRVGQSIHTAALSRAGDGKSEPAPYLRPPGALDESAFRRACTRCTDCLEACPYDAIRRLGPEFGDADGTPAIIVREAPCYLCQDMPCVAACTTGALRPVERQEIAMGTAVIDLDQCYQAHGQPCDYCVTRCPLKQAAINWDDRRWPKINPDGCVGCGVCAHLCPAEAVMVTTSASMVD